MIKPYAPSAATRGVATRPTRGLGGQRISTSSSHFNSSSPVNTAPPSSTIPQQLPPPMAAPSAFGAFSSPPLAPFPPAPIPVPMQQPMSFTPLQPVSSPPPQPSWSQQSNGPNYNIGLPFASSQHQQPPPLGMSSPPLFATPPSMGSVLAPSKPATPSWQPKKPSQSDWGDFDPLG